MTEQLYNLVTRKGFIREFYQELSKQRKTNPRVTQEEIFEHLNNLRDQEFGEPQFKSYGAFRKYRDTILREKVNISK